MDATIENGPRFGMAFVKTFLNCFLVVLSTLEPTFFFKGGVHCFRRPNKAPRATNAKRYDGSCEGPGSGADRKKRSITSGVQQRFGASDCSADFVVFSVDDGCPWDDPGELSVPGNLLVERTEF